MLLEVTNIECLQNKKLEKETRDGNAGMNRTTCNIVIMRCTMTLILCGFINFRKAVLWLFSVQVQFHCNRFLYSFWSVTVVCSDPCLCATTRAHAAIS